jgi:hypothetical protein
MLIPFVSEWNLHYGADPFAEATSAALYNRLV